jgi:flagella basal body P-ring formation protein FlgA
MKVFFLILFFNFISTAQISIEQLSEYVNSKFKNFDKVEFKIDDKVDLKKISLDNSRLSNYKSGYFYLPVIINERNNPKKSILKLNVKLLKNVFLAKSDIPINSTLKAEDFNYELRDVTQLRGNLVEKHFNFNNYRTKFFIKKGSILEYDLIEELPVIKSGDKIILEVRVGSVIISSDAIARQNAKIGDKIDVLSYNNEILKAKIISPQKALLE